VAPTEHLPDLVDQLTPAGRLPGGKRDLGDKSCIVAKCGCRVDALVDGPPARQVISGGSERLFARPALRSCINCSAHQDEQKSLRAGLGLTHLLSRETGASSPASIQPLPAFVSTSTQVPERLISLNCVSLAAVPITRPFLRGADRIFAGPRFTIEMTSVCFGAAAG
jgi:hypothetical protein